MIKPRLRLYVCASAVAVTLGGSMLTHAAGPGEFISKLWKRDAVPRKEVKSGFSPFRWLKRSDSRSETGHVRFSDSGRTVVSERPELVVDPFLAEQQRSGSLVDQSTSDSVSNSVASKSPVDSTSRKIIVRPEPRRRDQQLVSDRSRSTQTVLAPRLPDHEELASRSSEPLPELTSSSGPGRASVSDARPSSSVPQDGFVENFDGEFQRLFREVIEESRQQKERLSSPKLPDGVASGSGELVSEAPVSDTTSIPERPQRDDSPAISSRSRESLDDLIRQSRSQMESSVLARRADPLTPVRNDGESADRQDSAGFTQNSVSAVSHSASRFPVGEARRQLESDLKPRPLPDRGTQTDHQLIVPSDQVPDGRLFNPVTTRIHAVEESKVVGVPQNTSPALQPVVRVIPGDRGNGVVIDTGRSTSTRPRVSSNVAPFRSVPDTSQFRRLSFEGSSPDAADGGIQAISDVSASQAAPHSGEATNSGSAFFPGEASRTESSPGEGQATGDIPLMMIPDSSSSSMDAAELGASLAAVPGPPGPERIEFEWPDESEIGPVESAQKGGWGFPLFCLSIVSAAVFVFFRRKSQAGAIGMIGTGAESEIS